MRNHQSIRSKKPSGPDKQGVQTPSLRKDKINEIKRNTMEIDGQIADVVKPEINGAAKGRATLLKYQQRHGNQFMQRILEKSVQTEAESEVAPEIESAIDQSRGGGQALDSNIKDRMESVFNTDFGNVRTHTNSRADSLNRALNARAFTTGQDIFFRQGEYQPGSSTGQELLAHELTHVVQQRGGRVQQKLRMGNSYDSYEQEADVVAKAATKGLQGATANKVDQKEGEVEELHRLQKDDGFDASSAVRNTSLLMPYIQAKRINYYPTWWGSAPSATSDSHVWFEPHAELYLSGTGGTNLAQSSFFPSGARTSFSLSPGSSGVIRIAVNMGWFQDNVLFNYAGSANTTLDWDFTVTSSGELSLRGPSRQETTGSDGAQLVMPVPVQNDLTPNGGTIRVTPQIISSGSVSSGSNVGAQEVVGGGFSGSDTTPRVGGWSNSFAVDLVVPRPAAPIPTTYVTNIHFDVNSDTIEEGGERHIVGWYRGLPADARQSIEDGNSTITLSGHASTTQPGPANRELSRRRAQRVQQILQDIAGSNARFRVHAYGEYRAGTLDDVEDHDERRVNIDVTFTPE